MEDNLVYGKFFVRKFISETFLQENIYPDLTVKKYIAEKIQLYRFIYYAYNNLFFL